jgi:hypothetical protein
MNEVIKIPQDNAYSNNPRRATGNTNKYEERAVMLLLGEYHSASLTIVFMTSQFSGTSPPPQPPPHSLPCFPKSPDPGPRVYISGTVCYEIAPPTNHVAKKKKKI